MDDLIVDIKLWGKMVGSLAWDNAAGMAVFEYQRICLSLQQIIKHRHSFLNGHGRPRAAFFMK